jgi:hypothetical protein
MENSVVSDLGRYRKIYVRLWRHPGFAGLVDGEKVLALYVLTGTQTNRLGLYAFSIATAAEELGTLPQTIKKRLAKVCVTFGWSFDPTARVVYIPSWWRWNPPENINVLKGSLKDLNEIPPCSLVDAFAQNIVPLSETLHETFVEGLRQRLTKPSRNQDPDLNQKEKQKYALRANGSEGRTTKSGDDAHSPPIGRLIEIARETLKLTNPNGQMDELVDAFGSVSRQEKIPYKKADAVGALNVALAERRNKV